MALSNFDRLVIYKMSQDAIPRGGGFGDGLRFLSNKHGVSESAKSARRWATEVIRIIKTAPNLLEKIEAKRSKR